MTAGAGDLQNLDALFEAVKHQVSPNYDPNQEGKDEP